MCELSLNSFRWGMLVVLVGLLATACGGGTAGTVLEPDSQNTGTAVTRTTGVLIQESEIANLPDWQLEKFNDSGWNQPYIAPLETAAIVEPSGDLLLDFARQIEGTEGGFAPRAYGSRSASWMAGDPPAADAVQGEYELISPGEIPPFGCNSDAGNEHNGHALEDVIIQESIELPDALSYVSNGMSEQNWFNRIGGHGNDAQSSVYQLFARTTGLGPGESEQYGELSYRADLAPGVGPGGNCVFAQAWLVTGLIWQRFNSVTTALPQMEERYVFDILIAPSSAETSGLMSSGRTTGRYQEFYCGNLESCFGGGWIVGVESSSSGCEAFDSAVAAAYEAGNPWYYSPVYGLLLKRWQQQELTGMAGPWEGAFGWPVQGPLPLFNGAIQMSSRGTYYAWGMWFERGFMAWIDYDQESYPETPDIVQTFVFNGSNVFCPASGNYQRIKPDYRYGGSAVWPAPQGQPRVAVAVNGYRYEPDGYWVLPEQSADGEYQIGVGNAGMDTIELTMTAQAWGGEPGPGCIYDYYIWAFRDGTIYMGNEAEARTVTHTYGSETRNLESTYVVRVQVSDSTGAVGYGDSYPITFGHGGACSTYGDGVLLVNDDQGNYQASWDALNYDLATMQASFCSVDYSEDLVEVVLSLNPCVVVWYRGGPANQSENDVPPRAWTDDEIDTLRQLLLEEYPVLLFSQDHGYYNSDYLSDGWRRWYDWDEEDLSPSIEMGDERFLWALGMTEAAGVTGTGEYGTLRFSPRNLPTTGSINSKVLIDGYEGQYLCGAEYHRIGDGDIPLTISFGQPSRMVGYGYRSQQVGDRAAPGFTPGLLIDRPFEDGFDMAYVSGGCKFAPYFDAGYDPGPYDWSCHGYSRIWWIGYPWATTEVTESYQGTMVGAENRYMLLQNILYWLDPDFSPYGYMGGSFNEYDGPPEIIQVNIGTWHDGAYDFGAGSRTWDGTSGEYPDQTMANPYVSGDTFVGDYVVTTSRNNDWKNCNDIDFSFPWYAYIVDVNDDGVQTGTGNNVDDTVFFGGLLLEDPGSAWARDLTFYYYGQDALDEDDNVPSAVIDGFNPPVVVAGYYVSTTGDTGGEVRANYGSAPASTTIDNADKVTAECIAHWPESLHYGGVFYPGGYLRTSEPYLIWSMYPGHKLPLPEDYDPTGAGRIENSPMGWDSYRWMFDVDPAATIPAREGAAEWNKPVFPVTDRYTCGRVVYFDYSEIPRWNPDLNRDGDDNSLGINDTADKFPIRVRLITEYADYVNWSGTWPDHLPDPGIDPAEGGPIWYDDVNDPPQFFADWPDYIEGGAYVVDMGDPTYPLPPPLRNYGEPPHQGIGGDSGNYSVTFNFMIAFGHPDYSVEFNIGYEETTGNPLTSFGEHGVVYSDWNLMFNGAHTITVTGINAPGDLPEYTDLYCAIRVRDSSNPIETLVYVWEDPIRFEPAD